MSEKTTAADPAGEEQKRMSYIEIDRDRCKGCYFCVKFCPRELIAISEQHNKQGYFPAEFCRDREDQCTGCRTCAIMCPDTAIEVFK
jgi:2-oxoglutarate ferredoxin oxidoreductase subunit delta